MYLDFWVYSGVVMPTDQEMIAMETTVFYFQVPRDRGHATPCRATGECPGLVSREGEARREHGPGWPLVFSQKRQGDV